MYSRLGAKKPSNSEAPTGRQNKCQQSQLFHQRSRKATDSQTGILLDYHHSSPARLHQKIAVAPSMPENSKWEPRLPLHETIMRCPQHAWWCQRKSHMMPGPSSSVASNELPTPHGVHRVHIESLNFCPPQTNIRSPSPSPLEGGLVGIRTFTSTQL